MPKLLFLSALLCGITHGGELAVTGAWADLLRQPAHALDGRATTHQPHHLARG